MGRKSTGGTGTEGNPRQLGGVNEERKDEDTARERGNARLVGPCKSV